jgi:hypothetical protein
LHAAGIVRIWQLRTIALVLKGLRPTMQGLPVGGVAAHETEAVTWQAKGKHGSAVGVSVLATTARMCSVRGRVRCSAAKLGGGG